jgi:hypothetical protein
VLRTTLLTTAFLFVACDKSQPEETTPPDPAPATEETAPSDDSAAEEKHFDVSADKSGALARAAAVLEAEGIDNPDLQELSHHTEKLPSAQVVCKHMVEVQGSTGGIKDCVAQVEHHIALLGPELWGAASACFMEAKTPQQLDVCTAAEEEAEKFLHDQPHGEGLDEKTCQSFFEKFEKLAMEDKKDDAEHVKQVLDTVREDIVRSCMDQSTQAEMDCADKAKTLHELEQCAEKLV